MSEIDLKKTIENINKELEHNTEILCSFVKPDSIEIFSGDGVKLSIFKDKIYLGTTNSGLEFDLVFTNKNIAGDKNK